MNKIITICAAILMSASVFAQSPNKMSYQAVIRNASNALVTNQAIGMRISILQNSPSGTVVYIETQTPSTNANGLVSIEIGGGAVVSGTLGAALTERIDRARRKTAGNWFQCRFVSARLPLFGHERAFISTI